MMYTGALVPAANSNRRVEVDGGPCSGRVESHCGIDGFVELSLEEDAAKILNAVLSVWCSCFV